MASTAVKSLLRLYPRSWRDRYGREMAVLIDELPARTTIALDLLLGAATAYALVIRGNRILSSAGAYLHGVSVAVLLQAIALVLLVLSSQRSTGRISTTVVLGPFQFASVQWPIDYFGPRSLVLAQLPVLEWLPGLVLLAVLLATLVALVTAPRLIRTPL